MTVKEDNILSQYPVRGGYCMVVESEIRNFSLSFKKHFTSSLRSLVNFFQHETYIPTSFPGFSVRGRAGENPGNEIANILLII